MCFAALLQVVPASEGAAAHVVAARALSPAQDVLLVSHAVVATRPSLWGRLDSDEALVEHLQETLQLPPGNTGGSPNLQVWWWLLCGSSSVVFLAAFKPDCRPCFRHPGPEIICYTGP